MKIKILIILLMLYIAEGACYSPTGYTLPSGLQSVNGSSNTGGCQPESCVMMPYGGSTINSCDCPGNFLVSGVLIDGVIPNIDTQNGTWARELFTVNRNGQDSIMIGFEFSSEFYLREIEIVLFQCPILGIGITGVNIYSSFLFPAFIRAASTLLVTHSSPPSDNCQSVSTISIPVQPPMAPSYSYFIDFLFTGGSSVNQLNWLYLGEIRLNDEIPALNNPTESEVTSNPSVSTTTTTAFIPIFSTSEDSDSGNQSTSQMYTEEPYSDNTPMTPTTVSTPVINFEPEINSPVSITTTVAPLAGVIGLLLMLLMGLCGFFFSFYFYTRKRRQSLLEAQQNQNVNNLATEISTSHDEQNSISMFTNSCYQKPSTAETTSHDEQNSIPMFTNSCYQRPSTLLNHEVSDPSTINCNRSTGRYDDTDVHYYDVIPENIKLSCENESISDTAWTRN